MKNNNTNDRRSFIKMAGAALVAASVPVAIAAQKDESAAMSNNMKQLILYGGCSEPNPNLPGVFGLACYQFQMRGTVGGGGFATISDPVFTQINSQIEIHSGRLAPNDSYIFQGTVKNSNSSELNGKAVTIKVQTLKDDNCDVSLTIDSPTTEGVLIGLLLPAVQKVRVY